MIGDSEYRAHARPRMAFDAVFKYGLRPHLAIVGMFGYGWNGYTSEESWLSEPEFADVRVESGLSTKAVDKQTVIAPFTGGLEYRFGEEGWVPYVGAGGGIYMLQLFHERRVAEDPRTQARHRSYDFGLYGRIGIEQFVTESMSVDYEVLGHAIFSEDREKFPPPSGRDFERYGFDFNAYGGDAQFVQLRAGVRYYWGAEE
jgi:opacity protein-like surface antigen